MNIYRRFFRVTSGPLMEHALRIEVEQKRVRKLFREFCDAIGAVDVLTWKDGRIAGFDFDGVPCPPVWGTRKDGGARMPRGNTKEGKALRQRISDLPEMPRLEAALKTIGLGFGWPVLFQGHVCYLNCLFGLPSTGVLFVSVPWRDVDPAELAEYQQRRAAGVSFDLSMDHLAWVPAADMVEVKEWEVRREIEEINASLKVGEV